MTNLRDRKSRLAFETTDELRERGAYRPVIVEASPEFATLRLKGTRRRLTVSWVGVYQFAAQCEANRIRREKAAEKAARKKPAKGDA